MEITVSVTIKDPTPEAMADIDAFLTRHAHVVRVDNAWTPERARTYYDKVPERAKRILLEAVRHGGTVTADTLRTDDGKGLRGHAGPLKTALTNGAAAGLWPHTIQPPVLGIGPGYGPVQGYKIHDDALDAFRQALTPLLRDPDTPA
ncbi:hypothetical protein [Streptomyces sp. NPDC097619]|uniref:hypothetical protein n=1 Tax=Streptomyces sp. NPDC097619 TaxID=3157228 RepID=UPI003316C9F8